MGQMRGWYAWYTGVFSWYPCWDCLTSVAKSLNQALNPSFIFTLKKKEEREWHKRSNDRKYNIEVFPLLVEPMKNEDQLCMIENEFINYIPC